MNTKFWIPISFDFLFDNNCAEDSVFGDDNNDDDGDDRDNSTSSTSSTSREKKNNILRCVLLPLVCLLCCCCYCKFPFHWCLNDSFAFDWIPFHHSVWHISHLLRSPSSSSSSSLFHHRSISMYVLARSQNQTTNMLVTLAKRLCVLLFICLLWLTYKHSNTFRTRAKQTNAHWRKNNTMRTPKERERERSITFLSSLFGHWRCFLMRALEHKNSFR